MDVGICQEHNYSEYQSVMNAARLRLLVLAQGEHTQPCTLSTLRKFAAVVGQRLIFTYSPTRTLLLLAGNVVAIYCMLSAAVIAQ